MCALYDISYKMYIRTLSWCWALISYFSRMYANVCVLLLLLLFAQNDIFNNKVQFCKRITALHSQQPPPQQQQQSQIHKNYKGARIWKSLDYFNLMRYWVELPFIIKQNEFWKTMHTQTHTCAVVAREWVSSNSQHENYCVDFNFIFTLWLRIATRPRLTPPPPKPLPHAYHLTNDSLHHVKTTMETVVKGKGRLISKIILI